MFWFKTWKNIVIFCCNSWTSNLERQVFQYCHIVSRCVKGTNLNKQKTQHPFCRSLKVDLQWPIVICWNGPSYVSFTGSRWLNIGEQTVQKCTNSETERCRLYENDMTFARSVSSNFQEKIQYRIPRNSRAWTKASRCHCLTFHLFVPSKSPLLQPWRSQQIFNQRKQRDRQDQR